MSANPSNGAGPTDGQLSQSNNQGQDSKMDQGKSRPWDADSVLPDSNVIVNYLPSDYTESALHALFAPFGHITYYKIVRDFVTRQSMGYGFVQFTTPESANSAISALNGYEIYGKRLKVSLARPSSVEIQRSNLYLSGLPLSWTKQELHSILSNYGQVIEARVLLDASGASRGVGFCRLATHQSALDAIRALNGTTPQDSTTKLTVKLADTPSQLQKMRHSNRHMGGHGHGHNHTHGPMGMHHQQGHPGMGHHTHSHGGMPHMRMHQGANNQVGGQRNMYKPYTDHYSRQHYYPASSTHQTPTGYTYGSHVVMGGQGQQGVFVPQHQQQQLLQQQQQLSGAPMGQGKMDYRGGVPAHTDGLSPSLSAPHGQGRGANATPYFNAVGGDAQGPRPRRPPTTFQGYCLFVYDLPQDATEDVLASLFSPYGTVCSTKVMRDLKTGASKGFGFVNLLTEEMAQTAIRHLDGYKLGGKSLTVSFKK